LRNTATSSNMSEEEILLIVSLLLDQVEDTASTNGLTVYSRHFRQAKSYCGALLSPDQSPFMHLFNSKHDDALVTF
jgi:hypothetical protein